jgi:aryl-alcohol dehydrogenase-like predicted oxidoreductase
MDNRYVTLGRSGLRVSPFCLGAMTFGTEGGWGCDVDTSERILETYLDRGGNFIDTANFYTNGHSEVILGDFFSRRPGLRDRLVLASKFFGNMHPGDPNGGGASRKAIISQLEASLRRLRTDYLDLYYLHNHDPHTPLAETLDTLDALVAAGKIRYVGFSNTPAWFTAQAATRTQIVALQVEYSLLERTIEGELAPLARHAGIGLVPYSPLAGGFLSGKYRRDRAIDAGWRGTITGGPSEEQFAIIEVADAIARELGTTTAAVALAWTRARPGVASPILGARGPQQLEANLAALDVTLAPEHTDALDAASAPRLGYPHAVNRDVGPMLQFAGTTVDGVASTVYPPLLADPVRD